MASHLIIAEVRLVPFRPLQGVSDILKHRSISGRHVGFFLVLFDYITWRLSGCGALSRCLVELVHLALSLLHNRLRLRLQ